jgi:hypothetical protein
MATAFACATAIGVAAQTPSGKSGFVLANATMGSGSTSGSTVGTTGTTAATARGTSYVLEGRDAELKSHVGHKIEVTGTIEPKSRMDPATAATPGAAPTRPSDDRLTVTSIKMVAAECTPK